MEPVDIKECEPGAARQWVRIVRSGAARGLRDVCGDGPAGAQEPPSANRRVHRRAGVEGAKVPGTGIARSMVELFAGVVGGFGLFMVGMWLLTENLKALTTRRLRRNAGRLTENRFSALAWGALAGAITQSMSAMTFIVMSLLRSGLITPRGSLALVLGGCVGLTGLVVIVTFDIKVISLYVLGFAGAVVVSERLSRFRRAAASLLGGAMLILGLVLLKDAAAPLAEQPWFQDMLERTGDSIALAFVVASFLTFAVQSSSVVTVLGINLAAVGIISVDQAIMIMYGSIFGSGAILFVLSAGVAGQARQVAMYLVGYNALTCAVLVPLLYCEIHFGIPLVKEAVLALDLELDQQLAAIYVFLNVFLLPVMLAGLTWSVSVLERLWPTSQAEQLSRPQFIHDHASVDVDTSLMLVDLEQRRAARNLSRFFDAVRRGESIGPLRDATRKLISDVTEFLDDLQTLHSMYGGFERHNSIRNRQKLLVWLEDSLGALCETLAAGDDQSTLAEFRMTICESVDSVLLSLVDAMESDDRVSWDIARRLTGDRGEMMREVRTEFLRRDPPLQNTEFIDVMRITNSVEETFFLFSKIEKEFNHAPVAEDHVAQA